MRIILLPVFCIVLLSGCAIDRGFDYTHSIPKFDYSGKGKLAVGAQDLRPFIVSGEKNDAYVGVLRNQFYFIPWGMLTSSRNAFSQDVTSELADAVKRPGELVLPLVLSPKTTRSEIIQAIKSSGASKALILTIHEWESDSYIWTRIVFDLEMEVIVSDGKVLASKRVQGSKRLLGFLMFATPGPETTIAEILQEKLEELFAGDISSALHIDYVAAVLRDQPQATSN